MKNIRIYILAVLINFILILTGCSSSNSTALQTDPAPTQEEGSVIYSGRLTIPSYLQDNATEHFSIVEEGEDSITYELTEQQQKEASSLIEAQIKDSINQVLSDKNYYPDIIELTVNNDYSQFDVIFTGTELNVYESTLRMSLYVAGDKLQLYRGTSGNDLLTVVNYIDHKTGKTFSTGNSRDLHSTAH